MKPKHSIELPELKPLHLGSNCIWFDFNKYEPSVQKEYIIRCTGVNTFEIEETLSVSFDNIKDFINQNQVNMNSQQLNEGYILNSKIEELESEIETVKNCHAIRDIAFYFGGYGKQIPISYVNFDSLKKNVLQNMKKRLSELKKSFEKI